MAPANSKTFLLICLQLIVSCQSCIWLQNSHKDLPKKMLNTFQNMILKNETTDHCLTNRSLPDTRPLYKISQVDSAAKTVQELFDLMLQFYRKHQEKLVSNPMAWEQLQEDLCNHSDQLKGCISVTTAKPHSIQKFYDYFSALEKILEEQDDAACARKIIYVHINRSLLQATHLSARMRRLSRKIPQ